MAERVFMKGCEAIAEAVRAGCRFCWLSNHTNRTKFLSICKKNARSIGGSFVQGELEVASVNMLYGAVH